RQAKNLQEALLACGRNVEPARTVPPLDPAEVEAATGERGADRAGEMRAPFGPVDAVTAEHAAACARPRKVDPEPGQKCGTIAGDLAALGGDDEMPARAGRCGQAEGELPGEMVVAEAGAPQRFLPA